MRGLVPALQRRASSLRWRFMAAILLWVLVGISGIWVSATRVFARHITQQYHEDLYGHVRELAMLVAVSRDGHITLTRPLSDPRFAEPGSGYYWQASVWHGDVLRSASMTHGALDEDIAHSPQIFHDIENGPSGPVIAYGFVRNTPDNRNIHYVVATDKRYLDQAIAGFTRELTLWLAGLAFALVASGLLAIAYAIRPLNRLGEAVAALRSGRREPLKGAFPAEISPLVADLNVYIVENQAIIERARVAAGNLAHCLRTPLAVIADEAETLADSPATRPAGTSLLRQCDAMAQQIEYHLARARSAALAKTSGQSSRLPDLFAPLLAAMRKLHAGKRFDLQPGAALSVAVDPADLAELLSILLDNAGKWARQTITITITAQGDHGHIAITDDGPGMSEAQIAEAFGIGVRFDRSVPGSGLGLAIARDIAQAYGLGLELHRAAPAGLCAQLRLPLAPGKP